MGENMKLIQGSIRIFGMLLIMQSLYVVPATTIGPTLDLNFETKGNAIVSIHITLDVNTGTERSVEVRKNIDLYAIKIVSAKRKETMIKDPYFFSQVAAILYNIPQTELDNSDEFRVKHFSEADQHVEEYLLLNTNLAPQTWKNVLYSLVHAEIINMSRCPQWTESDTKWAQYGVYALQRKFADIYKKTRLFFGY